MWNLYDELIAAIPVGHPVEAAIAGQTWSLVSSGSLTGLAATVDWQTIAPQKKAYIGCELRELAALAKSWNLVEASLGMAAINAWHNQTQQIEAAAWPAGTLRREENGFTAYSEAVRGKSAAIIGHFRPLHTAILPYAAEVQVLERQPSQGDFPDSACEYLLPGKDFVFITGSAMVNKTMPRLLQLAAGAKIILVGPSTVLSPILLRYGVSDLCGFLPSDAARCRQIVCEGRHKEIFSAGTRITIGQNS